MTFLARRVRRQAGRYVKTFVLSLAVASSVSAIGGCSGPAIGPATNLSLSATASNAAASYTQSSISASSPGSALSGSFSGLEYDRATQTFNSVMTLTNNGATSVSGPFTVVISTGSSAVTVAGSANGSTYIANVPGGAILPGHSANVVVEFADPTHAQFTPTITSIVAGTVGQPPSALSYPAPVPFLLGKAIAPLTPTVSGTVTSYSVVPPLPAGISINATTGVISGTPSALSPATTYTISAANSAGHTSYGLQLQVDSGPTVHLTASASDANGNTLTYQWKTTDGALMNVNGSQADWLLPSGPGLHFAYVLVSNGHGGYTEKRIVVNTDVIGNPPQPTAPNAYVPSALRRKVGEPVRLLTQIPDSYFYLQDPGTLATYPAAGASGALRTNVYGEAVFQNITTAPGPLTVYCSIDGVTFGECDYYQPNTNPSTVTGRAQIPAPVGYAGHLYEGSLGAFPVPHILGLTGGAVVPVNIPGAANCGTVNEFFGVASTATATLLDAGQHVVLGPVRAGDNGSFAVFAFPGTTVVIACEQMSPLVLPYSQAGITAQFPPVSIPSVNTLTATFNGTIVSELPPAAAARPSDRLPQRNKFLGFMGVDSQASACEYYLAIGVIQGCDPTTNAMKGGISFEDWKRFVRIDSYGIAGGPATYTATYINRVDLNLARNHHSVSYGPGQTAAYVCNHAGPTVLDPEQSIDQPNNPSIDTVIDNTVNRKNLVACVAMDYLTWPASDNGAAITLTRFMIFGPNGQLLPSINLDGRGEKYVPGACVACHGGDHYAGRFAQGGSPDIGGHFLPYDTGNFEFSSKPGLTEPDQTDSTTSTNSIFHLNQNVNNAGPTAAMTQLIQAWYANGKALDKGYVNPTWPPAVQGQPNVYRDAYARSCRTCHVALPVPYNFEYRLNLNGISVSPTSPYGSAGGQSSEALCGPSWLSNPATAAIYATDFLNYTMPNSAVTLDRLWESLGSQNEPDQVSLLESAGIAGPPCALP